MKKEEALKRIETVITQLEGICTNKLIAQMIMTELEFLGMLPPKISKVKKYTTNGNMFESIEYTNEWENT